jgi:hypothetical protein
MGSSFMRLSRTTLTRWQLRKAEKAGGRAARKVDRVLSRTPFEFTIYLVHAKNGKTILGSANANREAVKDAANHLRSSLGARNIPLDWDHLRFAAQTCGVSLKYAQTGRLIADSFDLPCSSVPATFFDDFSHTPNNSVVTGQAAQTLRELAEAGIRAVVIVALRLTISNVTGRYMDDIEEGSIQPIRLFSPDRRSPLRYIVSPVHV